MKKVKENLSINLQYQIQFDHKGERKVKLVYLPTTSILGVHALSGKWQTSNGFTADLPKANEIKMLTAKPLAPKQKNFYCREGKGFCKKITRCGFKKSEADY